MSRNNFTATYSPDDNKLRLYAISRLEPDLYARVRAAGFIWAPKQELFVAPMWTPERADLLLELAGEIDDEDTSLTERAEERAERFETYHDNRTQDAESAAAGVRRIADNIPFGQPILIGHHSERHARKDAERIESGMRRAVKMWETAEYWTDRAAGAIGHAKYKELPNVRARRIKTIEADRRKVQKNHDRAQQFVRYYTDPTKLRKNGEPAPLKDAVTYLANLDGSYYAREYVHPSGYVGPLSLWAAINDNIATPEEVCAKGIANHTAYITHAARWLSHYDNRLAYEKAMLGESGGTAADKTGPEKGGGCKCWASPRGGWSYIVKVNKVSVTVLDNWGNGGNHFTRTIPFDKLSAIMSRTDVEQARTDGRLIELQPDSTGKVAGFMVADRTLEPIEPDTLDTAVAQEEAPALTQETVNAMRATLRAGVTVAVVPDLFPTPRNLAQRMVDLAEIEPGHRVLEPSAGTGAILGAMGGRMFGHNPERGEVSAVEQNYKLADRLRTEYPLTDVRCTDFLSCNGNLGTFDRIVMNPPFRGGADIRHIQHARHMLRTGGRLIALCANGPRQQAALQPVATHWIDLPDGSFSAAGTNVRVALLVIDN